MSHLWLPSGKPAIISKEDVPPSSTSQEFPQLLVGSKQLNCSSSVGVSHQTTINKHMQKCKMFPNNNHELSNPFFPQPFVCLGSFEPQEVRPPRQTHLARHCASFRAGRPLAFGHRSRQHVKARTRACPNPTRFDTCFFLLDVRLDGTFCGDCVCVLLGFTHFGYFWVP